LEAENHFLSESIQQTAPFMKSLDDYGGFSKIMDKYTQFAAICSAILAILSVFMRKTQPVARLWTICEAIFAKAIFGQKLQKSL
jgi:hypothetical protein